MSPVFDHKLYILVSTTVYNIYLSFFFSGFSSTLAQKLPQYDLFWRSSVGKKRDKMIADYNVCSCRDSDINMLGGFFFQSATSTLV